MRLTLQTGDGVKLNEDYKGLPSDPAERSVVVVLPGDGIRHLEENAGPDSILLNPEIAVLRFPIKVVEGDLPCISIIEDGLGFCGAVLCQNPFERNRYNRAETAIEEFALEKFSQVHLLCAILGASECVLESAEGVRAALSDKKSAKAYTHLGDGDRIQGETKIDISGQVQSRIDISTSFSGGDPDLPKAREVLKTLGLAKDLGLRQLVEMRSLKNNICKEHCITIDLSVDSNRSTELLGSLKIGSLLGGSAEFDGKSSLSEFQKIKLQLRMKFSC
jgi:hypothetical protein